jgi:hypothetical protein
MNKIYKTLERFGLSENEAKVYLEITKHQETSPYEVSRNTNIPRTTVYDVIMGLALKGLIEVKESRGFEKQQTKIIAKNPSVLRELIAERHKELANLEVDVVDVLPELKGQFLATQASPDFQFYPGIEGLKYVLNKSYLLDVKTEICVWDNMMPMDFIGREMMNDLVDKELTMRREMKIHPKALFFLNDWTKHVLSYQCGRDPDYLTYHEFRYLDEPQLNIYQDIYIYADTVATTCAKQNEAWGMVIKSELYAQSMRNIFYLSWVRANPVTLDFVKSFGKNEFLEAEQTRSSKIAT